MRIHSACEYMTIAEDFIRTELNYIDTHFADSFTHDKTRVILHNEMYISRAKSILEVLSLDVLLFKIISLINCFII